ncbi:MAG: cytochrome oxidase putative small subunit CydP [Pseudomonadota bacterium]|jgi:hypothetical protein
MRLPFHHCRNSGRGSTSRLPLEITLALAAKAVILYVIWTAWFAHPAGERLTDAEVGRVVFSNHAAVPHANHEEEPAHAARPGHH